MSHNLGWRAAYESLNRLQEAEQSYKAVIALRPDYWAGYNRLGTFYLRHGRLEEAAQMYTQVTSLVPDSFVGFANLGITRIQQGRYSEAIEPLNQSLKIRKTGDGMSNLAMAYFQSETLRRRRPLTGRSHHSGRQELRNLGKSR